MKKIIILFAAMLVLTFSNLNAKSSTMIGGGLGYGLEIEELAIQVGAIFDIDAPVLIAPDFKYFLVGDGGGLVDISWWEINANAHYYLTKEKGTNFYLLGGLQYANITVSYNNAFLGNSSASDGKIGLNVGAGANFDLGGFNLLPEIKFTLGGNEQLFLGVSAMFGI